MTDSLALPPQISAAPVNENMESSSTLSNGATVAVAAAASYWDEHNSLSNKEKTPLVTAANLIAALDTAYADMNSLAASAAREVEAARRNAREASEVTRRYRARSYPKEPMFVTNGHPVSPSTSSRLNESRLEESEDKQHPMPINGNVAPATPEITASRSGDTLGTNGSGPADWGTFSPTDQQHYEPNPASTVSSSVATSYLRKRKNFKLRSSPSAEQLAHSHAEDVLSLSLELERAKLALQSEQMAHTKTKSALAEVNSKNSELEAQIQKLLNHMETQREDHGRKMDRLEEDLERAKMRVKAAEEDAQEALDLAKSFSEHRDELEDSLQRSLQEIQVLRGSAPPDSLPPQQYTGAMRRQPPHPPKGPPPRQGKKGVRFADMEVSSTTSDDATTTFATTVTETAATPTKSQSPRSMVSAGRQLLQRHAAPPPPPPPAAVASPEQRQLVVINPQRSAERRNRLRERLHAAGSDIVIASPPPKPPTAPPPPPPPPPPPRPPQDNKARESCQQVGALLRESAQRIGFTGHWWTSSSPSKFPDEVEAMTRSYCQSVEVKLERQSNDVKELQSLCSYLENHLVVRHDDIVNEP